MSRYVAALVYRKKIGSMARKAILAYCAERANDDGTGVWASKVTIAKEVECTKKTVIETMNALVSEGILSIAGRRKISNGFVHVYDLNLSAIQALENAISADEMRGVILHPSPEVTPRGVVELPQEVTSGDPNRPRTVLKPSIEDDLFFSEKETSQKEQTSQDEKAQKEKQAKEKVEADFARFWSAYPKKAGKPAARKAWDKAIRKDPPERIIEAAVAYARIINNPKPGDFTPHPKFPQGWLNDERWRDQDHDEARKPLTRAQVLRNSARGMNDARR